MNINPNEEVFEQAFVFDKPALFTSLRIDKSKLPEGVFAYDVRHSDYNGFEAAEIKEYILVNHMGTIITKEPLDLGKDGSVIINDEDDFGFTDGYSITLAQFMNNEIPIKEESINVLIIEPLRQPFICNIDNKLTAFQQKVGGYIEVISPFNDDACLICNEEGKIKGLPLNRKVGSDIIAGTFIIAGSNIEGDFISLTDKQIDKYKLKFNDIEFLNLKAGNEKRKQNNFER